MKHFVIDSEFIQLFQKAMFSYSLSVLCTHASTNFTHLIMQMKLLLLCQIPKRNHLKGRNPFGAGNFSFWWTCPIALYCNVEGQNIKGVGVWKSEGTHLVESETEWERQEEIEDKRLFNGMI